MENFIEGLTELKKLGARDYSFKHDVMYVYGNWNFPEPWLRDSILDQLGEMGFHWQSDGNGEGHFYKFS